MSLKDYLTRLSNNLKTYLSYQNQQPKQKKKVESYVVCYIKNDSFFHSIKYFNTKEEMDNFILNIENKKLDFYKLEYIGNFAFRKDVIKKTTSSGEEKYLTAIDRYGYAIYNKERSRKANKFIWEYEYGDLKDLYKEFRDRGIIFENDIYSKLEKEDEELVKLINERIYSKNMSRNSSNINKN